MRLDKLLLGHARNALERVDVLREVAHQEALVVQQLRKVMARSGLEVARVELLCQGVEWLRTFAEVVEFL